MSDREFAFAGERFTVSEALRTFAADAQAAIERGDLDLAEKIVARAERFKAAANAGVQLGEFDETPPEKD